MRVLLVLDDYNELLYLQTLLKKLGFDVDGIQNDRNFSDTNLAFHPSLVIATAVGKRVNGIAMAEGLNKTKLMPKVILLAPPILVEKLKGKTIDNVDRIISSPVQAKEVLLCIAQICSLDPNVLMEKYRRIKKTLSPDHDPDLQLLKRDDEPTDPFVQQESSENQSKAAFPLNHKSNILDKKNTFQIHSENNRSPSSQGLTPSTINPQERKARFQKALASLEKPKHHFFSKNVIEQFTKEIRKQDDLDENPEMYEERKNFVVALFKKAK